MILNSAPRHLQKRHSKKGMIEVQFNWIFVLVAGFVIFLFIISIIMSQKKHADNLLNIDLVKKITTTLRGKQQLSNTYSEVSIPDLKIYFNCDNETGMAEFRLEGSQAREPLNLEILFAKEILEGNMLYIWTQDFSIPFTVTRFMYITNPQQLFVVYNSSPTTGDYATRIYQDLPSNISKVRASSTDLDSKISGYKDYKIICFNNDCPTATTYSYINITPSSAGLYTYGNVTFHKVSKTLSLTNTRLAYISHAGLFGAIFSDDAEYYDCQMKRALQQFEIKRALHYKRLFLMQPDIFANNTICYNITSLPMYTLNNMGNYKLNDSAYIYRGIIDLERDNKDLGFKGCPQVY